MDAGFDLVAVVLGFAIHLAISVAWAVPFVFGLGAMVNDAPLSRAIGYHVFFGLAVAVGSLRLSRAAHAELHRAIDLAGEGWAVARAR
jgi:hypothetical protein